MFERDSALSVRLDKEQRDRSIDSHEGVRCIRGHQDGASLEWRGIEADFEVPLIGPHQLRCVVCVEVRRRAGTHIEDPSGIEEDATAPTRCRC